MKLNMRAIVAIIFLVSISALLSPRSYFLNKHHSLRVTKLSSGYKSRMTLLSLTGVSLDKPLLPAVLQQTNLMYFERYLILAGLTVFVFLLRNRYFSATRILLDNTIKDDTNAMMSRLCGVIYAARSFAQSMQTLMLTLSERISFPLRSRVQESKLLLDDWTVCRLVAVDNMDADWTKYRFQFDGHASSIVDLDVGQQIVFCLVDAQGRVHKKSFYSMTSPTARGCVEILGRGGNVVTSRAEHDFDFSLKFMDVGEEIAVKRGERRLRLPATDGPISSMVLVASGEGILPALQLLRAVGSSTADTSVEKVNLLWINDGKREFVLNSEVEELQQQQGARFTVTRVVDRELGNANTLINSELQDALPEYTEGAVGLVLAEGTVADKCSKLLTSRGYPESCVARLTETAAV